MDERALQFENRYILDIMKCIEEQLENIPNVSEDELWQNLATNQKI